MKEFNNRNSKETFAKLPLVYLLHFIYIPACLFITWGEDLGTVGLVMTLVVILSIVLYVYNLVITLLCLKMGLSSLLAFLFPIFLFFILYYPAKLFLDFLDLFSDKGYFFLITISLVLNMVSFVLLIKVWEKGS